MMMIQDYAIVASQPFIIPEHSAVSATKSPETMDDIAAKLQSLSLGEKEVAAAIKKVGYKLSHIHI